MEFCQRVGSKATTVSEIVGTKDEAVYQAIEQGIQRVNKNAAARPYHIQKWAILQKDFSISGGELGRGLFSCLFVFMIPGAAWEVGGLGRALEVPAGKQPGQAQATDTWTATSFQQGGHSCPVPGHEPVESQPHSQNVCWNPFFFFFESINLNYNL